MEFDVQYSLEGFLERLGLDDEPLIITYEMRNGITSLENKASDAYHGTLSSSADSFDGLSYVSIDSPESAFSSNFSMFFVYEKDSEDAQILFSSLKEVDSIKRGFLIGVTSNNKLFFEFEGQSGPIVFVSSGMFGKKNAVCISKFEDSISLHLYDTFTDSVLTDGFFINKNDLLPSFEWFIGGSPNLNNNTSNFKGDIDYFVYFNDFLNGNIIKELFKSFYSSPKKNFYVKTSEFSNQSVSGLTANYVSINLSILDEIDQYVQKKYLINEIGSLNVNLTGAVDQFGDCSVFGNISGNIIRTESQEQTVLRYIKTTTETIIVEQNQILLGTIADESKNVLGITGLENVFGEVSTDEEVGEDDDWDSFTETIEMVEVEVEEPVLEDFDFVLENFSSESNYVININYSGNGRTLVTGTKTIEYTNESIQSTPITITKTTQEFFSLDPNAVDEDVEYKNRFGFDSVSVIQYAESGYKLFIHSDKIEETGFPTFSLPRNDFITSKFIASNSITLFKNGVFQIDKGRNDTFDIFLNRTRDVLGDYSIYNNIILTKGLSSKNDILFYDNTTPNTEFLEVYNRFLTIGEYHLTFEDKILVRNDWGDGVLEDVPTSGRVFFLNGKRLIEGNDYQSLDGKFQAISGTSDIFGTLVSIDSYLGTSYDIDRYQELESKIQMGSAVVFLNGIRVDPNNVIHHSSNDSLSGKVVKSDGLVNLINASSDRIEFWKN